MNEQKFPTEMLEQFAQLMRASMPTMPTVKANKNGYEIRTKVLEFAQNQAWQDYHSKWGQFETSISKDGSEFVTKVAMPAVPGAKDVLDTAQQFYDFVNGKFNK
jgi:hypothetical protein